MKQTKMKQNKVLRRLTTLAMAAMLCIGGTMTALAAPSPSTGTEASPAGAVITKNLEMADGTAAPTGTFTFNFTKVSEDGAAPTAAMPTIPGRTVAVSGMTSSSTGGVTTLTGDTVDILTGITFPHAGIYEYSVTEADISSSYTGNDSMTCSGAAYTVRVYVENGVTNPAITFAKHIEVVKTADDTGASVSGGKVDMTATTNEFVFVNTFAVTGGGGTNPTTSSALKLNKTVTGAYGDKTMPFAFELTMTKAALDAGTPTYKLYLFNNGTLQTTIPASVLSSGGSIQNDGTNDYIEVTAGTPVNVNLAHGQELSVLSATVGTTYKVTETGVADYTPSVNVTTNGTAVNTPGTIGANLSTGNSELISAGANSAAFTNAFNDPTSPPTGFGIDSLPFVLLIGLVVGAFVVVGVTKYRKKNYASK